MIIVFLSIFLAGFGGFLAWLSLDPKFRDTFGYPRPISEIFVLSLIWPCIVAMKFYHSFSDYSLRRRQLSRVGEGPGR